MVRAVSGLGQERTWSSSVRVASVSIPVTLDCELLRRNTDTRFVADPNCSSSPACYGAEVVLIVMTLVYVPAADPAGMSSAIVRG